MCYPCCRWAISTSCCYLTFFVDEIFPCLFHHIVILSVHEICCHRCQTIRPSVNIGWLVVFFPPTNLRTCDRKQLTGGSPAPTPTLAATRPAPLTRARNGGEGCRGRGGDQHVRGQPRGLRRRRRGPRRLHLHPRGLSCRWVLRLLRFNKVASSYCATSLHLGIDVMSISYGVQIVKDEKCSSVKFLFSVAQNVS